MTYPRINSSHPSLTADSEHKFLAGSPDGVAELRNEKLCWNIKHCIHCMKQIKRLWPQHYCVTDMMVRVYICRESAQLWLSNLGPPSHTSAVTLDASGCRTCDFVSVRVDRVMMIFSDINAWTAAQDLFWHNSFWSSLFDDETWWFEEEVGVSVSRSHK